MEILWRLAIQDQKPGENKNLKLFFFSLFFLKFDLIIPSPFQKLYLLFS